ncbi:MAG: hypothetical protein J6J13_00725 [Clostridia bacterium]|nr:hypothetical protein [Clostridia bacterium]
MKSKRQEIVLQIIKKNIILTQDDLQNALMKKGISVTQSTLSRDIKELKLVKGHDEMGNYRYLTTVSDIESKPPSNYKEMIANSVKSVDSAMNDVVVKCYNGMASSVCVAIDIMFGEKMLGSIAGDDTIFIVTHNTDEAFLLCEEIKKII